MRVSQISALLLILIILSLPTSAQDSQKEMALSLNECMLLALEKNLGVKAARFTPQMAQETVTWTKEKFLPRLSLSFSRQNTSSASFSWIEAAEKVVTKASDTSVQLAQLLPSGGAVSFSLSTSMTDTNRSFQTINPRYGCTLSFSLSHPLLRNFGPKMARREVIVSELNRDISEYQFLSIALDTIFNVEQAYWNLVFARENLAIKEQSLELARELLSKNRREVEIGMLAPIEILTAEAEVAAREAEILQARLMVDNSEDLLRTTINLEAIEGMSRTRLIPSDTPSTENIDMSLEEATRLAMDRRPDLKILRLDLKNRAFNLEIARNQLLPDLNLFFSVWSPGISGTQILYLDNNPLSGIIVGKIPGGPSSALNDALNLKYKNWSLGLTFTLPAQNFLSRAQVSLSRLGLEQGYMQIKHQEQQILLEVRNAFRAVQTNFERIHAYQVARELAEQKLAAEEKKLSVGLTTNYLVLQHQRDLTSARTAELRAIIDYNLSLAYLYRVLGISLEKKGLSLDRESLTHLNL